MDNKIKWGSAFCTTVLALGLYIDNKPAIPLDINNPTTLNYDNILRSAKKSDPAAQHVLGMSYLYGSTEYNIQKDIAKAQEWLKKSADNAYPASAYEYARSISDTNPKDAEKYYNLAITKGFTPALFSLSQLKIHEGTPNSVKEGLALLVYAAGTAKDPLAKAYLAVLQYEGAGIQKNRIDAIVGMQKAVNTAPTPETRNDWDIKQKTWTAALTTKEKDELSERLLMDSFSSSETFNEKDASTISPTDISALIANLPVNSVKAVAK